MTPNVEEKAWTNCVRVREDPLSKRCSGSLETVWSWAPPGSCIHHSSFLPISFPRAPALTLTKWARKKKKEKTSQSIWHQKSHTYDRRSIRWRASSRSSRDFYNKRLVLLATTRKTELRFRFSRAQLPSEIELFASFSEILRGSPSTLSSAREHLFFILLLLFLLFDDVFNLYANHTKCKQLVHQCRRMTEKKNGRKRGTKWMKLEANDYRQIQKRRKTLRRYVVETAYKILMILSKPIQFLKLDTTTNKEQIRKI